MSRRDNWGDDRKAAEREKNRQRMARYRQDPEYRERINARRKERDRERKSSDPSLRKRLTENSKRFVQRQRGNPEFWARRHEYLKKWRSERRIDEEFEEFMARIEGGADEQV